MIGDFAAVHMTRAIRDPEMETDRAVPEGTRTDAMVGMGVIREMAMAIEIGATGRVDTMIAIAPLAEETSPLVQRIAGTDRVAMMIVIVRMVEETCPLVQRIAGMDMVAMMIVIVRMVEETYPLDLRIDGMDRVAMMIGIVPPVEGTSRRGLRIGAIVLVALTAEMPLAGLTTDEMTPGASTIVIGAKRAGDLTVGVRP
jgi:hypothetical protein